MDRSDSISMADANVARTSRNNNVLCCICVCMYNNKHQFALSEEGKGGPVLLSTIHLGEGTRQQKGQLW